MTLTQGLRKQLIKIPDKEWKAQRIHETIMEFMKKHTIIGVSKEGYLIK